MDVPISAKEAQNIKTDLLQARLKKPETEAEKKQEQATGKAVGKVAGKGAKMAAASLGAVDPVSQKAAEIAGKIAGEKLYKHRRKIIFIWILCILIPVTITVLLIFLPIIILWAGYCKGSLVVKATTWIIAKAFGINLPCP